MSGSIKGSSDAYDLNHYVICSSSFLFKPRKVNFENLYLFLSIGFRKLKHNPCIVTNKNNKNDNGTRDTT